MRPFAALLGIVMGSAVSLAVGLFLTLVVILLVPQQTADRLAAERMPLLQSVLVFTLLSAASAWSFYGELRERRWRWSAFAGTVAMLGVTVWLYWPR